MTLYRKTLVNLINSVISVDEYEPKSGTNDEVIVVALELDDEQPAQDLNKFIQRGVSNVIDSDVSPNPNEHGKYLTFIEFKRNNAFYSSLLDLIEDISNLTGEQKWQVQVYKSGKLVPLYDKSLKSHLDSVVNVQFNTDSVALESLLRDSDAEIVQINENTLILGGTGYKIAGNVVSVTDDVSNIIINESFTFTKTQEVTVLSAILGENWQVSKFGKYIVAENSVCSVVLSDVERLYC